MLQRLYYHTHLIRKKSLPCVHIIVFAFLFGGRFQLIHTLRDGFSQRDKVSQFPLVDYARDIVKILPVHRFAQGCRQTSKEKSCVCEKSQRRTNWRRCALLTLVSRACSYSTEVYTPRQTCRPLIQYAGR